MSEAKFTKGEWFVVETDNELTVSCDNYDILTMWSDVNDAQLIAAAPKRYKALDEAWKTIYQLIDEINDQRMNRVHSGIETPPDLYDMEQVQLIQMLLAEARGELN